MRFARARRMFDEDLLAGKRRIASSSLIGISTNLAIRVPHIVAVLFVKGIVGDVLEALAPEGDAVLESEAETFEKERIL